MKLIKKSVISACVASTMLLVGTTVLASTGIVNADTLNLRKSPSTSSSIIKQLNKNQKVEILEENGDWYKVNINGAEGYLHKDYVKKEETPINNDNNQTKPNEPVNSNNNNNENKPDNTNQNSNIVNQEIKLEKEFDIYILPLVNSNKIAKAKKGEVIRVISNTGRWLYIETEEVNGWIVNESSVGEVTEANKTEEVKTEENPEEKQEETQKPTENPENNKQTDNNTENKQNQTGDVTITQKTMYVNSASVYVRKGPGTNYEAIDSLVLNAGVFVIAENGDWYKVKVSGVEGYIAKRLLSTTKQEGSSRGEADRNINTQESSNVEQNKNVSSKGEEIVVYAKQFLGCKYVYGGAGPTTFDCSGFTMYVYSHFGINLSHGATAQSKKGTYVAKSDLQPGDLVFFKDYETMVGIGHCGIYIGNGDFIHASSGTGYCVKISTLLSGSYNTRYETARRIL